MCSAMKVNFYHFFVITFLFISCKAKQEIAVSKDQKIVSNTVNQTFFVGSINSIDKEDLLFQMVSANLMDQVLNIQVQFGGGCISVHQFELVTNGVITADGVMEFFVLHKTHDDYCKALLIKDLTFNLNEIYNLESEKLKSIKLNNTLILNL